MRSYPLEVRTEEALLRHLCLKTTAKRKGRLLYILPEQRRQFLAEFMTVGGVAERVPSIPRTVLLAGDGGVASVELGEILGVCAEAPLPRVLIKRQYLTLDGAGGIASMLQRSSLSPAVFCPSGVGTISALQRQLLGKERLVHFPLYSGLPRILQYTRHVFAGNHHISHFVNQELVAADSARKVKQSIGVIQRVQLGAGLLCIIDRGEGGMDPVTFSGALASAKKRRVPVVYDAKARELVYNNNVDIIKVNQDQIRRWFGITNESDEMALKAAELVRVNSGARCVVYTRRTQGVLVTGSPNGRDPAFLIRPQAKRLFDLVSVGDIVTAAFVFCLARYWPVLPAACFAATAAEFGLDRRYEKQFDLRVLIQSFNKL